MEKRTTKVSGRNTRKSLAKSTKSYRSGNVRRKRASNKYRKRLSSLIRTLFALGIVLCFSFGFYYFFIRPYSYRWKSCSGYQGYGVCMPRSFDIHGVDISHYQGKIDWAAFAQNKQSFFPIHFIFMKATEGGDLADKYFMQNFDSAYKYNIIRGAYHFFQPKTDAIKQAQFFINHVSLKKGDLPPVLDVETTGKLKKADLQRAVKIWLDEVESHYGVKPILYASWKFKEKYLDGNELNKYPYWIAHYYADSVHYQGEWKFWQHTDVGSVPGIEKLVDLNVFNGTLDELKRMTIR